MEVRTDAIRELLGRRGIREADVEDTVKTAESSGVKVQEGQRQPRKEEDRGSDLLRII